MLQLHLFTSFNFGAFSISRQSQCRNNLGQKSGDFPISRQNLGRSGNSEIPDGLGFSRHMKTRLKKAFDTVDHSILLSKLQAYGIQGSTNQWFCSYLKNRTQTCIVNGNKSSKMFLRCGVPQGTILGPSISIIYK